MTRYSALLKAGSSGFGVSLARVGKRGLDRGRGSTARARPWWAGDATARQRASPSVLGSATVGPEPMVAGSSPGTSEIASVSIGAARRLAQTAALDARDMAADRVHLVDIGAAFEEPARQGGLGGKIETCHGRGPQAPMRRRTTRQRRDRARPHGLPSGAPVRPPRRYFDRGWDAAPARPR